MIEKSICLWSGNAFGQIRQDRVPARNYRQYSQNSLSSNKPTKFRNLLPNDLRSVCWRGMLVVAARHKADDKSSHYFSPFTHCISFMCRYSIETSCSCWSEWCFFHKCHLRSTSHLCHHQEVPYSLWFISVGSRVSWNSTYCYHSSYFKQLESMGSTRESKLRGNRHSR